MHDNVPLHLINRANRYLNKMGFKGTCLMKWLASLLGINLIENLQRKIYIAVQQFTNE